MPTTTKGVFYMPSDQELNCDRNIARWKRDLYLAKRQRALFKSVLGGTGYRDDAEYNESNRLAGLVMDLERAIKIEQGRKRKWAALTRKNAARLASRS